MDYEAKSLSIAIIWTIVCGITMILIITITGLASSQSQREERSSEGGLLSTLQEGLSPRLRVKTPPYVTIAFENIIAHKDPRTRAYTPIMASIAPLKELMKRSRLVVIARVDDDADENLAKTCFFEQLGFANTDFIASRFLTCSSLLGRSSIVRQLAPAAHFESKNEVSDHLHERGVKVIKVSLEPMGTSRDEQGTLEFQASQDSACKDFAAAIHLYDALSEF